MSAQQTHDKLAAKKAAVLGSSSKSRAPLWAGLACVGLLAAGAFWYFSAGSATSPAAPAAVAAVAGETVSVPAATLDDGKARYFEHKDGSITIRYFVIKSSDGVIRAAFDACDVCWPAGKGYAQDGDFMVCGHPGERNQGRLQPGAPRSPGGKRHGRHPGQRHPGRQRLFRLFQEGLIR